MFGKLPYLLIPLILFLPGLHTLCHAQAQGEAQQHVQTDPVERFLWYDAAKTAKIKIFKAPDGKYYGKVVWLKVPDRDGKPKVDSHNPSKARRNDPLLGLLLLKGLEKTGDNTYENGTIYDPNNGKTYSCKLTCKGDLLDLHGYIGFSFIGRSTTWSKAE